MTADRPAAPPTGAVPPSFADRFGGRFGRSRAWLDLMIVDHGFLRLAYRHWHEVAPGLYRSNQPAPFQVRRAARFGIRTIVNLRGANRDGPYFLEREAAAKAGLALVDFPFSSRRAPPTERLLEAAALFDRIDYPALMHCKSGIDRSGLMAALFLLLRGRPTGEALAHFARRYGYIGAGPAGIGRALVQAYGRARAETGIDFRSWIAGAYDPAALEAAFRPAPAATALADFILRRE